MVSTGVCRDRESFSVVRCAHAARPRNARIRSPHAGRYRETQRGQGACTCARGSRRKRVSPLQVASSFLVVVAVASVALLHGYELGPALLCAMIVSPFVLLRVGLSWGRLKSLSGRLRVTRFVIRAPISGTRSGHRSGQRRPILGRHRRAYGASGPSPCSRRAS